MNRKFKRTERINTVFSKTQSRIILVKFVMNTVLLNFIHWYVYKQLKKAQMSGHIETSPGPQNTLWPQRVEHKSIVKELLI